MKIKFLLSFIAVYIGIFMFGMADVSAGRLRNSTYDLTYEISNGKVTITDCEIAVGVIGNVKIKISEQIDGKPVTGIGDEAFSGCDQVTSITIPDSVTYIGYAAFRGCGITTITIPDGVTNIDSCTFEQCSSLESIKISNNVENIGQLAFNDCCSLDNVIIPSKVKSIGDSAFYNCSSLTRLTILNGVTSIDYGAFYGCNSLTSVTIPSSVKSIEDSAFGGCSSLSSVTISNGVTKIGDNVFQYCSSLTKVTIPSSVTSIGYGAFSGCSSLSSVTISNGVKSIGDNAFDNCSKLASITVDAGNKYYCSVNGVLYNKAKTRLIKYAPLKTETSFVVPSSVTEIDYEAFSDCSNLKSITIPASVTDIGHGAFSGCSKLASITVNEGNKYYCSVNGVLYNKAKTILIKYAPLKTEASFVVPSSVTEIGYKAFSDCKSLTSIEMPNSVTKISDCAFANCYSLISIELPDSVTRIGYWAFENCSNLTSIKMSNSVTMIAGYLFSNCSNLKSIEMPNGVTYIDWDVFSNCNNLTSIELPNSITYIDWSDFSECSIKTVFYTGLKNEWNAIKTRFNTPAKLKIVCKKKYHFITNCKNSLPDITAYAIEASPEVKNDGKAFIGWYDNEALSGKPITFPYSGDSETLYAAWKDNAGTSFDDYIVIDADNPNTITAGNPQQPIYYRFVPSLTDLYVACAAGGTCCVYDSKKVLLECDNDIGNGKGYKLTAGETYYFTVTGNGTVDFNIKSSALPATTTKRSFVDGKNVFTTVPENLPINTQIILVCYKDGKFAGIQVGRNENKTLRFVTDKEVDYARVMAVESLDSMKPLGYAERVQ